VALAVLKLPYLWTDERCNAWK